MSEFVRVKCPQCGKVFTSLDRLRHHIECWHNAREFLCQLCGGEFSNKGKLRNHMVMKHREGVQRYVSCKEYGKLLKIRKIFIVLWFKVLHCTAVYSIALYCGVLYGKVQF